MSRRFLLPSTAVSATRKRIAQRRITSLYAAFLAVYTLNLHTIYRNHLLFRKRAFSPRCESCCSNSDLDLLITLSQWPVVLVKLDRLWKGACTACALLLPLSLGLLQIDGVINDDMSRTFLLASCMFSGTGLVVGGLYLSMTTNLLGTRIRLRWMEASQSHGSKVCIDFWTCLALPISSVAWSIICCMTTALVITWTNWQNEKDSPTGGAAAVGAVFLTALLVINVVQIYRVMKLLGFEFTSKETPSGPSLDV